MRELSSYEVAKESLITMVCAVLNLDVIIKNQLLGRLDEEQKIHGSIKRAFKSSFIGNYNELVYVLSSIILST